MLCSTTLTVHAESSRRQSRQLSPRRLTPSQCGRGEKGEERQGFGAGACCAWQARVTRARVYFPPRSSRYIAWLRQAYPSAERAGLLQVLERATHAFRDDPRYANSPAYVALWAEYVSRLRGRRL